MQPRHSLRRRLPLLISTLLVGVVAAVCWTAYLQIERVSMSSTRSRLTAVTRELATMLQASASRMRTEVCALATDPAIAAALARPNAATRDAAERSLDRAPSRGTGRVAYTLWSADRRVVAAVGPRDLARAMGPALTPSRDARATGVAVGPLFMPDSGVAVELAAPVLRVPNCSADAPKGVRGDTLGFVTASWRLAPREAARIGALIGSGARFRLGNASGDLWTDLSKQVPGPREPLPLGVPARYTTARGAPVLGVVAAVRTTPWLVWVSVPHDAAAVAAQPFMVRIAAIGLAFTLVGAIGAWALSRRVTAPLVEVTRAAEDLTRGDYARRVAVARSDELGSLAASFNTMAERVGAAAHALRAHARELEEANAGLRASEERYRRLVEASHEGICTVDPSGAVTYANARLAEMLGRSVDELLGRCLFEFMDERPASEARARFARRHGGIAETREVPFRRADGDTRWTIESASPLFDADGTFAGALFMFTDVTERRALESQLLQSQKMEAVGQLAGGVAHDFNNLLAVITSYTGLLLADLPADDPSRAEVEEIERAADRAAGLTGQLLAFSRQQVLQPRVLDLNAVVRGIEKMLGRLLREDVRLEIAPSPALGSVYADPGQLEQVIVNLAVNARDAMPNGGTLTIETANVELDEAYAHTHPEVKPGPYVMLAVSDTGVGMDAATQARMFEPFFSTKEVGRGTGLGLSTVYGIVKQSGGHVWVYSEPGRGTTFKVYLPRATSDAAAEAQGNGAGAAVHHGSETVLLVEDEAQVRTAARRVLERAGYTVLEAATGPEALLRCRQHEGSIDVLLTDVVMPEMSGRELAARFQALYPRAATVFMSGYTADAALRQRALEPGTFFVEKPFTPQTLTGTLREALGSRPHGTPR